MDINKEVLASIPGIQARYSTLGPLGVYREHVQGMATRGDLAILALVVDEATAKYRDVVLGPGTTQEIDLARGGILALRGIWVDLRNLGRDHEEEQTEPTTEKNEFAILPELEEDLTRTY